MAQVVANPIGNRCISYLNVKNGIIKFNSQRQIVWTILCNSVHTVQGQIIKKKHCLEYVLNTRNDLTGPKEKYDLHVCVKRNDLN